MQTSWKMAFTFSFGGLTTMDITVQKVWDDENDKAEVRPDDVTVGLYYDNNDGQGKQLYEEVTLGEDNNWYKEWLGLLETDWSIEEIDVPDGYLSNITKVESDNGAKYEYTVTNTYTEKQMDVSVQKVWEDDNDKYGKQPENVKVGLYDNGGADLYEEVTLDKSNSWYKEWTGLPVSDWTIKEVIPDGYEASIALTKEEKDADGDATRYEYTVTNTTIEYPLMQINVEKNWTDENGGDLPVADIPVDEFGNALPVVIGLFNDDDTENGVVS